MVVNPSLSRKIFTIVNYIFLSLITFVSLFPLLHILAVSFSSNAAAQAGWVTIIPIDISFKSIDCERGILNFKNSNDIWQQYGIAATKEF